MEPKQTLAMRENDQKNEDPLPVIERYLIMWSGTSKSPAGCWGWILDWSQYFWNEGQDEAF